MMLLQQIHAIWWRNLILKKRRRFLSICNLLIPLIMLSSIFYVYFKDTIGIEPQLVPETVFPGKAFADDCIHYMPFSDVSLLYTNQTDTKVQEIMKYINRTNSRESKHRAYFDLKGFSNEQNMENWVLNYFNDSKYLKIAYGIVFNNIDENEFSYKLKTNLHEGCSAFRSEDDYHPDFYDQNCLLSLQKSLAEGFLKVHNKTFPSGMNLTYEIFPSPQYLKPGALWDLLEFLLATIMFVSVFFTTILPVPEIVSEKETGAKELMRLIGIRRVVLWGGWLLNMLMIGLVNVTYTSVLLKVQFKEDVSALLPKSNIFLLWIVLMLFLVSMGLYVLFFCTLFEKPRLALFIVFLAILVPYLALVLPRLLDDEGKFLNILACIIFPQFNWSRTANLIVSFEKQFDGINFFNLFKQSDHAAVSIEMIWLLLSYLLSCLLFSTLIWYFDNIMPGAYGIAKPLYFPFQIFSQEKKCVIEEKKDVDEACFEVPPSYITGPTLSVRNLIKVFKCHLYAVNGVELDVYDGQITVLLGHNRAGKTTTLSMITGMYSPNYGNIYAYDDLPYNIFYNMDKFRTNLGFCPQNNLVIPYLTVLEHFIFFGMLKGMDKSQAQKEGVKLLERFNIQDEKNTFPPELSGGMKRKLCLAISFIRDPKIVILDEPTSGLDPESTRELWACLSELRHNHTIIIATDSVEEAVAFGDQIAVIDNGKIICGGSPMFLKKLYGTEYNLQLLTNNANASESDITKLIKDVIHNSESKTNQQGQLTYSLPVEESTKFATLFERLEEKQATLGITSMGIKSKPIEEVFLSQTRVGVDYLGILQNDGTDKTLEAPSESSRRSSSTEFLTGFPLLKQHFTLIFKKKFLCYYRSIFSNAIYLIIALASFCVVGWTIRSTELSGSTKIINLDLNDIYEDTKVVITYNRTSKKYAEIYNNLIPHGMERIYLRDADINQILLKEGLKSTEAYKQDYVVASSWSSNSATALYSPLSRHGSAISVNMLLNSIIKSTGLNSKLSASYQSFTLKQSQLLHSLCDPKQKVFLVSSFFVFIPFGLLFFLGNLARFPLQERLNDAKQLQLMTGLSPITYWLAIFIWDLLMYAILMGLAVGVIAIFDHPIGLVTAFPSLYIFVLLLSVFGLSGIVYAYFFTFLMSSRAAVSRFVMVNLLIAVVVVISIYVVVFNLLPIPISIEVVSQTFIYIVRFIPPCCLGIAMLKFAKLSTDHLSCMHCTSDCKEPLIYFGWDDKHLSNEILFLGISFFVYVLLIAIIEYHAWEMIYECVTGLICTTKKDTTTNDDDDVINERVKVHDLRESKGVSTQPPLMVVDGLAKRFGTFQAVKGVSFQIYRGECFGLLGVKGVGKKTILKMLTGALLPTAGNASINNYSLDKNRSKYLSQIGYCPQLDGVNELITARETLVMIGQLRGISKPVAEKQASKWIDELDMINYADRHCCNYSGGNHRKLSLAMALMANPVMLFLDEPTSGVDPVSRRKLWAVLAKIQKEGQSVLLTSHSEDECGALCNRIMVKCQMECPIIEKIPFLKQLFAQSYTVLLKTRQLDEQKQLELEDQLNEFGSCKIIRKTRIGTLQYYIKKTGIRWSQLFRTMDNLKNNSHIIEDYTICETTLEQVIISNAREDRK